METLNISLILSESNNLQPFGRFTPETCCIIFPDPEMFNPVLLSREA